MMALPDFLSDIPSHFNWGIDLGTAKAFSALKLQLDEHLEYNPGVMTIQALLFQSFIHVSKYKDPKPDYVKGREYLKKAYKEMENVSNEEEKQGYLTVAKCNEAFMTHRLGERITKLQEDIQDLLSRKTDLSQAAIDSVRGFALSRVGMRKYDEAKIYYQRAVDVQPENTQWLFGLALVTGRRSRNKDGMQYSEDKEKERKLYEKIISLQETHALAHVFLAYNLSFKGEHAVAARHASRAKELAPSHPHLLIKASKVFRRGDFHQAALKILQEACLVGNNSALFHETGLLHRAMYNEQNKKKKDAIKKREPWVQPDKSLLHKAAEYFTKALEANPTNNVALRDRALIYERLGMTREADDDFVTVLTVTNADFIDQVQFNVTYAFFLQRTMKDEEKACERFRIAIDLAVTNCIAKPPSRANPIPAFDRALRGDLRAARREYADKMEKKLESADPQIHSEGVKGLAWLHHVFGEHDIAKAKYEEYLSCAENRNDYEAIVSLVKSLILLGDFEVAREKIQGLEALGKTDLAKQLIIQCALEQGEEAQTQGNHNLAKTLFQEAVDYGSMEGCHKMANILIKNQSNAELQFRIDCSKVLHCCELNDQRDIPLYEDIKKLLDLEDATYGKLRNWHLSLELALLNTGNNVSRNILEKASQTLYEARSMLDRVMITFRGKHYSAIEGHCMFFHIQQDDSKHPKTEQQIKDEIVKKLTSKPYKWDKFDTRFPALLDFLVKLQPAYPKNTDYWYLALSQLANRDKHLESIRYSRYHIPVILNGNKATLPIPQGLPVYGDATVQLGQVSGVQYELVEVVDVARKAAIKVESTVAEFYKYM